MTQHARRRLRAPWSLRLLAATVSIALIATGCDSATAPAEQPIVGSYTLTNVGGNDLPTTLYEGPYTANGQTINVRLDVAGGTLTLDNDEYVFQVQLLATIQGQTAPLPIVERGSYTRNGKQIAFTSAEDDIGTYRGELNGTGITLAIDLIGDEHPPIYQFRK